MVLKINFFYVFYLALLTAVGQSGIFFHETFTPKQFGGSPQNWGAVQDASGKMYFANTSGLLQYNGKQWELSTFDGFSAITAISIDPSEKIFIGGFKDFGLINTDLKGKKEFHSLINDSIKAEFTRIWKIISTPDSGTYFCAFENIYRYHQETLTKVASPDLRYFMTYQFNNTLFTSINGVGLRKIEGDSVLEISPSAPFKADTALWGMVDYDPKNYLILSRKHGVFLMNKKTFSLKPLNHHLNKTIQNLRCYSLTKLSNNEYAIVTNISGTLVIDNSGEIIRSYNSENGFNDDISIAAFQGKDQILWLMGSKGINKVLHNFSIDYFNKIHGIEGPIYHVSTNGGRLTLHGGSGIQFQNEDGTFKFFEKTRGQSWKGEYDKNRNLYFTLLANELIAFKEDKVHFKWDISTDYSFLISKAYENTLYIPTEEKLFRLAYNENSFQLITSYDLPFIIRNFYEVRQDLFLFATEENFTGYLEIINNETHLHIFDSTDGISANKSSSLLVLPKNQLFLIDSDEGLKKFDPITKDLLSYTLEKDFGIVQKDIITLFEGEKNQICAITKNQSIIWINKLKNGGLLVDSLSFNILDENTPLGPSAYCFEANGFLYVGSSEELFRYNPNSFWNLQNIWQCIISSVYLNQDSLLFGGNDLKGNKSPIIAYDNNDIRFEFEGLDYVANDRMNFSYFLEGYDSDWSKFDSKQEKEYTNLTEGTYTFHVKAKNIFDRISTTSTYSFEVQPPIYRTIWAYLFYFIGGAFLIFFVVKINERRLLAENEKLEKIVMERTAEIEQQKEELQVQAENLAEVNGELSLQKEEIQQQADELNATNELLGNINSTLEDRNKSITDSITYAKRIQDALLPSRELIETHTQEHFVFYQPKDIVGGDFYWFHPEEDDLFFAVIDCTGHGVPGGFMSMMGNAILNEIVSENRILEVDKILNTMRERVIKAVSGGNSVAQRKDGMDVAICKFNKRTKLLEFAGAHLNCYLLRNGQLVEIQGDMQPIGSHKKMTPFIKHSISLQKDENAELYLFTDGYVDQFGGARNKKFKFRRLRQMLSELSGTSMIDQGKIVQDIFSNWRGEGNQTDDVTFLGLKL